MLTAQSGARLFVSRNTYGMKVSKISPETVAKAVIEDGFCCLEGFFDAECVAAIRREGEAIRDQFHDVYGETEPIKIMGGWRLEHVH